MNRLQSYLNRVLSPNDAGEVIIPWRRIILVGSICFCVMFAMPYVVGYILGKRIKTQTIAFSISQMVMIILTGACIIYFARRQALGLPVFQFSMRALLVGITLACLLFGLHAWDRQMISQGDAIRKNLHATIMTIVGDGTVYVTGSPGKTSINVRRPSFGDDDLKAILQLVDQLNKADAPITSLWLSRTAITDDGVSSLAGLDSLEICHLDGSSVTDASIDVLERLPRLRNLFVMGTRVTDGRLSKLSLARPDLFIVGKSKFQKK